MTRFFPIIGSILIFAAALAVYAFLSLQIWDSVSATGVVAENLMQTGQQDLFQKNLDTFIQNNQSDIVELGSYVVKDADVVAAINQIEGLAKREKVSATIDAVSVGKTDWQYHEPLQVTLSATGSFPALAAFAADLESLPKASHLKNVSVDFTDKDSWYLGATEEFVKEKPAPSPQ